MRSIRPVLFLGPVLLLLLVLGACSSTGPDLSRQASLAMKAGVDAARNGYWHEAKFRFEQALELTGDDGELWNNLAVAHETLGEHEEARAAYERAKQLMPSSNHLSKNIARFDQFYSSYVASPEPAATEPSTSTETPNEGDGSDNDQPTDSDRG